jgi:hypothetical protein
MSRTLIRLSLFVMVAGLSACSQQTAFRSCGGAGAFSDQTTCMAGTGSNNCVMTTVTSPSGSNSICWKSASATTTTGSNQTGACADPWILSEWSACTSTTANQTRTVDCKPGCTCPTTGKPATSQKCPAMLYTGAHAASACSQLQGSEFVQIGTNYFCGVTGETCPTGWTLHKSSSGIAFSTTEQTIENGYGIYGYPLNCASHYPITSGSHGAFYAAILEQQKICTKATSTTYGCYCDANGWQIIKATIKKVACY